MNDIFTEIQDYLREHRQAEEDWLIAERIWEQWVAVRHPELAGTAG